MSEPRYSVGIDLGTTHCVLAAADLSLTDGETVALALEPVAQLTAPGAVEERTLLPSFLYLPHPDELAPADLALPWDTPEGFLVGELARSLGAKTPLRLVASAKSWLCHPGIDRRGPVLPVEAPTEVARISPFDATVVARLAQAEKLHLEIRVDAKLCHRIKQSRLQKPDFSIGETIALIAGCRILSELSRLSGIAHQILDQTMHTIGCYSHGSQASNMLFWKKAVVMTANSRGASIITQWPT